MRGPSLSSAVVDELFRHGGQFAQMPEDGCVVRCSDNVGEGAIVLIAREVETVVEEHSCYDRHAAQKAEELVADLEIPVRISEDLPPHISGEDVVISVAGRQKRDCIQNVAFEVLRFIHGRIVS